MLMLIKRRKSRNTSHELRSCDVINCILFSFEAQLYIVQFSEFDGVLNVFILLTGRSGSLHSKYEHQHYAKAVLLNPPSNKKPHLVYGMRFVDNSNKANMRISTWVTSLTRYGFTYHMNTWADSHVYAIGTNWMACP